MAKNLLSTGSFRARVVSNSFSGNGSSQIISDSTNQTSGYTSIINAFFVANNSSADARVSLRYRDGQNLNGYFAYKHPILAYQSKMFCTWDTPIYINNNDNPDAYLWMDVEGPGSAVTYYMSYMDVV